ncbi:MAG: TIR domain-containing protein [Lachnospiraceae bacterium]|nr:TIR domain-containing protein [Lachnospiraceae bacterium]
MSKTEEIHYDAFISYRHSELDSFVAENLHRKLENFRLPKTVLSKVKDGRTRIKRVFRDVDELPLSDDLSDPISRALKNSDFLITVCTPRYLESRWCMKEIEVFLMTHPRNHILVVLAEDEPVNSFPEILCFDEIEVTDEDGETVIIKKEIEPLAADTRGENKKEILKAVDTAVIKLCAAIFGLNYDDLRQRHREQRMRRLAMIFGSIGAAILAFSVFATVTLIKISRQNVTIASQYGQLQESFASSMAAASGNLYKDGRKKDAVYAVSSVLSGSESGKYNATALKTLYQVMDIYKITGTYSPVYTYDADSWVNRAYISSDKKYILLNDGASVYVYDVDTAKPVRHIRLRNGYVEAAFCGSEGVIVSDEEKSVYYSLNSDESHETGTLPGLYLYPSNDGGITAGYLDGVIYGIDNNGETIFETDLSGYFGDDFAFLNNIIPEEGMITASFWDEESYYVFIIDTADGSVAGFYSDTTESLPIARLKEGVLYIAVTKGINYAGSVTEVRAIDTASKEVLWEQSVKDFWITADTNDELTLLSDDYIFLCGEYGGGQDLIAVLDKESGEPLNHFSYSRPILETWVDNGQFFFVLNDGSVYYYDDFSVSECTGEFFQEVPDGTFWYALYQDGDLFTLPEQANYITRYSDRISGLAQTAGDEYADVTFDEYTDDDFPDLFADSVLSEREEFDIDENLLDVALYSDDRKYIFALFTDHTARIFDAQTAECVTAFETADSLFTDIDGGLKFSDVTGSYILTGEHSYILDKDMAIICITDKIVDYGDDCFIMENSIGDRYKVPWLDPVSMIKMSEEYLGGYVPPEAVRQKYGLL